MKERREHSMKYETPFHVESGVILDASGRTVRLFGVNYYAPFNHNFYNIAELGKDHFRAVDEDFCHFRELGVRFIRIHLYDREITDPEGHLVGNGNLDVLDYVLKKAEEQDIYLMITPMVWWNTVATQLAAERDYAYWYCRSHPGFGFSNFYSKDSLLWNKEALECQKRYFRELFGHRSRWTGKRFCEHGNIVALEPCNEPDFVAPWLVETETTPEGMGYCVFSQGKLRRELKEIFRNFQSEHTEITDRDELYNAFNFQNLKHYLDALMGIVDEFFGNRVLKACFVSCSGNVSAAMDQLLKKHRIDAISFGTYLNTCGFDGANTDNVNFLPKAKAWLERVRSSCCSDLARIVYEFDATGTQNGYPLASLAAAYRDFGMQMAAYFTYTPAAVAAWNPGWLVHFLNLEHTPSKAAGFAAAAAIFHKETFSFLTMEEERWSGEGFVIQRKNDSVVYADGTSFIYSCDTDTPVPDRKSLRKIFGRGTSPLASCGGNSCYVLEKVSEKEWLLHLHPAQKFLSDPQRGRQFRPMANRWISCLKEPPVSQLKEEALLFRFSLASWKKITDPSGKKEFEKVDDCSARLLPGSYRIFL
ncbi:MAG: hypothetical protein J6A21_01065 [Lentisphaeria bacterium]|nr:hypothetical protein [Lentisphaeria bacterium]